MLSNFVKISAAGILIVSGYLASAGLNAAEARSSSKRSGGYYVTVKVPGQHKVRIYAKERGRGRPMLMLHGFGASGYEWRKLIPRLARNNRVIAIDMKGFGMSSKPRDRRYSIADQAKIVEAFIRRRGLRNITLVGHSLGGAVALNVALNLNHTGRIRRMVLMNAPAYPQKLSQLITFFRQEDLARAFLNTVPAEITAKLAVHSNKLGFDHVTFTDIRKYAAPLRSKGAVDALIDTAKQIVPKNFRALIRRYPTLRQPTLIIWCKGDPTVPESTGRRLNRAMRNARLRIISRCEHTPPEEAPKTTLHLMRKFLRRH